MNNPFLPGDSPIDLIRFLNKQKERVPYSVRTKVCNRYEFAYSFGEAADEIYIIKKGRIKIVNDSAADKTIIKNVFVIGDLFGEISLLGNAFRTDSAVAMEKTELYVLSLDVLYKQMKADPDLANYMMNLLGTRAMGVERRIEAFVFKTSRTRIIEFLSDLGEKRGERMGYDTLVRNFFTHQEIANMTSTSRQSVTTILNELRSKNILVFDRRRLLIRDLDLLRAAISLE